ncbi:MAG: hypothetical protein AAF975_02485 [Spirochaetota bacterium]
MKNKLKAGLTFGTAIALLSFLWACPNPTSSDVPKDSKGALSPPSWIHGTWADTNKTSFEFSSNNVKATVSDMTSDYSTLPSGSVTQLEASTSVYKIKLTASNATQTYTFTKVSATSLTYKLTLGTTSTTRTLTKK